MSGCPGSVARSWGALLQTKVITCSAGATPLELTKAPSPHPCGWSKECQARKRASTLLVRALCLSFIHHANQQKKGDARRQQERIPAAQRPDPGRCVRHSHTSGLPTSQHTEKVVINVVQRFMDETGDSAVIITF